MIFQPRDRGDVEISKRRRLGYNRLFSAVWGHLDNGAIAHSGDQLLALRAPANAGDAATNDWAVSTLNEGLFLEISHQKIAIARHHGAELC